MISKKPDSGMTTSARQSTARSAGIFFRHLQLLLHLPLQITSDDTFALLEDAAPRKAITTPVFGGHNQQAMRKAICMRRLWVPTSDDDFNERQSHGDASSYDIDYRSSMRVRGCRRTCAARILPSDTSQSAL